MEENEANRETAPWAWALGVVVLFLVALAATWRFYDADEFVNLQQALLAHHAPLYLETPSNHPPLYTDLLRLTAAWTDNALLAARIVSASLTAAAGWLMADAFHAAGRPRLGRTFLVFWGANAFLLLAGTRAMNGTLLTFLLAASLWAMVRGRTWAVGAAGLAPWTRYTAVFFLPALAALRPSRRAYLTAAASFLLLAGAYAILRPQAWGPLVEQTLLFHSERRPEQVGRRVAKAVTYGGSLLVAALLLLVPSLRTPRGRFERAVLVAVAGGLCLALLPVTHVHYFLPLALATTALGTVAFHQAAPGRRRMAVAALVVVTGLGQAVAYVPMTPQPDLHRAEATAERIRALTPPEAVILTDAPELALLAQRANLDGYYWSWQDRFDPSDADRALERVHLVAVSRRFGDLDRGFPTHFLDRLADLPCLAAPAAHLYWTGSAGPPPALFGPTCGP